VRGWVRIHWLPDDYSLSMNLLDAVVAQGLIYVVQCEGFVPECFLASLPGDYRPPHDGPLRFRRISKSSSCASSSLFLANCPAPCLLSKRCRLPISRGRV
jgi:hypothetical protein